MAKRSVYFSQPTEDLINISADSPESYSGRVAFLIEAGVKAAIESAPELTVGEWCAIAEAMNGHWPSYEIGTEQVVRGTWHSVYDCAPDCDEKWGISCEALAKHLSGLPFAAQVGAYEIGRAFWKRPEVLNTSNGYTEAFQRLGAKVKAST